jgi:hypothetical protein
MNAAYLARNPIAPADAAAGDARTAAAKLINSFFAPPPRKVENVVHKAYLARNPVAVANRWGFEESGHITGKPAAVAAGVALAAVAPAAADLARTAEARRINAFFSKPAAAAPAASSNPRVNPAYAARNPAAVSARWGSDGAGSTAGTTATAAAPVADAARATSTFKATPPPPEAERGANAAYLARNPMAVAARWGAEEGQTPTGEASATAAQVAALEAENRKLTKQVAQYEVNTRTFFVALRHVARPSVQKRASQAAEIAVVSVDLTPPILGGLVVVLLGGAGGPAHQKQRGPSRGGRRARGGSRLAARTDQSPRREVKGRAPNSP